MSRTSASPNAPTVPRWESFGWRVEDVQEHYQ